MGHSSSMLQTAVVAIRSVATYVAILVYIAVAAPLALVFGVVFRWKGGMFLLGHGGVGLALTAAGIRYRVRGTRPPVDSPVVFCSNHESNVDPPVLFQALHPRLHILYKAERHRFVKSVPTLACSRRGHRANCSGLLDLVAAVDSRPSR